VLEEGYITITAFYEKLFKPGNLKLSTALTQAYPLEIRYITLLNLF
jgi:hypothetical protein